MKLVSLFSTALALSTPTLSDVTSGVYKVSEPAITHDSNIVHSTGNVMTNGVNVYAIFYGAHSTSTQSLIANFVTGLSGSDWWGVVQGYSGATGPVTSSVKFAGSYQDNYSKGKTISSNYFSSGLNQIIENAIVKAKWPRDNDGIYVVFTAKDVKESSSNGAFCNEYCGYHGMYGTLKTTMVGDATSCPGTLPPPGQSKGTAGCMQRYYRNQTDPTYSINGNQNADSMIDVLAHELAETASDYDNAWRDSQGYENGDKCAPYFIDVQGIGATSPYNGAYNVDFGTNGKYLIQSMWSTRSQSCVLVDGSGSRGTPPPDSTQSASSPSGTESSSVPSETESSSAPSGTESSSAPSETDSALPPSATESSLPPSEDFNGFAAPVNYRALF